MKLILVTNKGHRRNLNRIVCGFLVAVLAAGFLALTNTAIDKEFEVQQSEVAEFRASNSK